MTKKVRGIRFEIPNKYDNYLGQIFKNIGQSDSVWEIGWGDAFCEDTHSELFDGGDDLLKNDYFYELANKKSCVFSLNLRMYKKSDYVDEMIGSYEELEQSNCLLALSIIDVEWISVYSKHDYYINKIKENAEASGFTKIEYITEENDYPAEEQFISFTQ